jgi:hypothetical protein
MGWNHRYEWGEGLGVAYEDFLERVEEILKVLKNFSE